jgi:hypothetical protein
MEDAFFRFEVEVVFECDLEYIGNSGNMCCMCLRGGQGDLGSNGDVVHVDADRRTQQVMFGDSGSENVIHESLKCGWQITEAEVHYRWFE